MRTTPTTRERLGAELLELRRRSGLTQKTAAKLAGIHPSFLSLIEHGKRDMALGTVGALANVYDAELVLKIRARQS